MLLVGLGTFFYFTCDALVWWHGGSVLELMFGKYIVQLLISSCLWMGNPFNIKGSSQNWYGDEPHRMNIWIRGWLLFCYVFLWWRALEQIPLGDGEAILFLTPLVTVISARIFLKEALPKTFPLTMVLSLVGLVFIVQPDWIFGHLTYEAHWEVGWRPIVELLIAVAAWSAASLLIRKARSAHWLQLDLALTTQSIVLWVPLAILIGRFVILEESKSRGYQISGEDWTYSWDMFLLMLALGILSVLAVMCNSIGYTMGEATKVAWMEYLDLVFAFWYAWLIYGTVPSVWEIIGCCFLIMTCFINFGEEWYRHRQSELEREALEDAEEEYMAAPLLDDADIDPPASAPLMEEGRNEEYHPLV